MSPGVTALKDLRNCVLGSYFTNNKTINNTQHLMILNSDCAENAAIDIFQFYKQKAK